MKSAPDTPTIFLDADVLIAGSNSAEGASYLILQLGEFGLLDLVSSAQAKTEAERNIRAKLPSALPAFNLLARAACRWVEDPLDAHLVERSGQADPKDLPILVAAVHAGCQALITFNTSDFTPPSGVIRIETPGAFVVRLRQVLARLFGDDLEA